MYTFFKVSIQHTGNLLWGSGGQGTQYVKDDESIINDNKEYLVDDEGNHVRDRGISINGEGLWTMNEFS